MRHLFTRVLLASTLSALALVPAWPRAHGPADAYPCKDWLIHDPQGAEVSECRLGAPGAPPADRA